jgi:hypothetical protein
MDTLYIGRVEGVPQQDVLSLIACCLDYSESSSSNKHGPGLHRFVKKMRMNMLLTFTAITLYNFRFRKRLTFLETALQLSLVV